jgi:hypothetical protein
MTAAKAVKAVKRGGVLVRLDGTLWFVPASVAVAVAPPPVIAPVPGAPEPLLGATLHDGDVVPVIAVGEAREAMLVCSYLGEKLGLVGGRIVGTGSYEPDSEAADAVRHAGESARTLDLASLYARVQGEGWASRWRA